MQATKLARGKVWIGASFDMSDLVKIVMKYQGIKMDDFVLMFDHVDGDLT